MSCLSALLPFILGLDWLLGLETLSDRRCYASPTDFTIMPSRWDADCHLSYVLLDGQYSKIIGSFHTNSDSKETRFRGKGIDEDWKYLVVELWYGMSEDGLGTLVCRWYV